MNLTHSKANFVATGLYFVAGVWITDYARVFIIVHEPLSSTSTFYIYTYTFPYIKNIVLQGEMLPRKFRPSETT